MFRISIFIVVFLLGFGAVRASNQDRASDSLSEAGRQFIDSLETTLRTTTSAPDSLRLLYDLFDVAPNENMKDHALRRIYPLVKAANMHDVMLEVLTQGANIHYQNDSILSTIEKELLTISPSDKQREALLFLHMRRIGQKLADADDKEHMKNLSEIIKVYTISTPDDPFERAEMLYALCINLGRASHGELLKTYIDKLVALTDSMPLPMGAVRNLIYTRAAPYFTINGCHKDAVEIDKKMLNIIDSLVTSYRAQGRIYRLMDTYRYACYRRMLCNYKVLSPLEIEHFNNEINNLAQKNARVRNDLQNNERASIFYAMATKQWDKALAAIKRQIENPTNKKYRNYLLNEMLVAAQNTGDRPTQLAAAMELVENLKSELEDQSSNRYRELQVLYDIVELKDQNVALAASQNATRNKHKNMLLMAGAAISIVLLAMVFLLLYQTAKLKRIAEHRRNASLKFHRERDELYNKLHIQQKKCEAAETSDSLKTDLLNNVSHEIKTPIAAIAEYSRLIVDCIPNEQQNYLNRFAKIIEQNNKIVTRLVDDVLDINDMESGTAHLHYEPTSIFNICNLAIFSVFEKGCPQNPKLSMVFNRQGKEDQTIDTDSSRVAQILVNLLSNAEKFTPIGKIFLDFDVDRNAGVARFYVEDTGRGVTANVAEKIFERFIKLDPHSPGCGLGLYIARMTANLLGGKVFLDTSYHKGARFILEIPLPNRI